MLDNRAVVRLVFCFVETLIQMAFNRAEKARTSRLSDACVTIQTAFRRHMFEHDYKVGVAAARAYVH